jgi:cytochrome b involved in lipid metabolism
MKFKAYSSVLLTAVFLSAFSMPSNAATIAGTKCTTVGATKTSGGLKHFCVKSGTKLIWNKGTPVKSTSSAIIVGTKCTKVGTAKTVSKVKYVCAKSGTKLIWEKETPKSSSSASAKPSVSATPTPAQSASSGLTKLTLEEVEKRNSSASCWSIVYGNVFDLTKWITKHPGGAEKIRAICGKDGTTAFERQHTGDGGAANQLSIYFLGKLGDSVKL